MSYVWLLLPPVLAVGSHRLCDSTLFFHQLRVGRDVAQAQHARLRTLLKTYESEALSAQTPLGELLDVPGEHLSILVEQAVHAACPHAAQLRVSTRHAHTPLPAWSLPCPACSPTFI